MPSGVKGSFHGMVGQSAPMQALFRQIERVAPLDVPVLILGETGTGKELVARAIQRLSRRRDRPFEIVNCGALVRELLLSELFGHERGAFTGAVTRKDGIFTIADGGTVFLDEVGELSPDAQAMLLRFFQEGEIRPVGSSRTIRVDVRVIAATHRGLSNDVDDGKFRADLYYRLRRVVLAVPALRARRDDLRLLVENVRVQVNARHGLAIEGLMPAALACVESAPWRGNVRELEAILEEAMIHRFAGWVEPRDLVLVPARSESPVNVGVAASGTSSDPPIPPLSRLQREALVLATERGEVSRAAFIERCRISRRAYRRELTGLVSAGLLRRVGAGRGTRYVRDALHPMASGEARRAGEG